MQHALALALAAPAAIAFAAAPAQAASVIYTSGSTIAVAPSGVANTYDGAYQFRVVNSTAGGDNGLFTATFTFTSPFAGLASTIAQNVIVTGNFGSDVDFTAMTLNGVTGTVSNSAAASSGVVIDAPIGLGSNVLTLVGRLNPSGNGTGNALVTGSLTLTAIAVPEPATWAMLVLGFGLIGGGMRRSVRAKLSAA